MPTNDSLFSEEASFWHPELPISCITPLVSTEPGVEQYFGVSSGTGFFAKADEDVYLITARHALILQKTTISISEAASRLTIPFTLDGTTTGTEDLVEFESITQLAVDEGRSDFLDVVALKVRKKRDDNYNKLKARAVKLPPSGLWLHNFVNSPLAAEAIDKGNHLPFVVAGYPNEGTSTRVQYADETDGPAEVTTQSVLLVGNLRRSELDHCLRLTDIHWPPGHAGLSGSPVFVRFGPQSRPHAALAGMIICAGKSQVHFIQVSSIRRAIAS